MRKLSAIAALFAVFFSLTSCEVEFSPNADWKEVPVVYCVLNQDDDTTWVRVQRCFLSEDNFYNHTSISDSTNYPQGALEVKLLKWNAYRINPTSPFLAPYGDAPVAVYDFDYYEREHRDGAFGYQFQPLYGARTYHQLDSNFVYQLVVLKAPSGDTLASAYTSLLGSNAKITKLNDFSVNNTNALFRFVGTDGKCSISWTPWTRARLYQPMVRFYYRQDGEVRHVDVKCPDIKDNGRSSSVTSVLSRGTFFTEIADALKDDTSAKSFVHYVDVMVSGCNEDLKAYTESISAIHSGATNSQVYTNIDNGIGIFGARRVMVARIPSDSAVGNETYLQQLVDLHVGFEKSLAKVDIER